MPKRVSIRSIVFIMVLLVIFSVVWVERKYHTGYRFSPEAAAKVNPYIGSNSTMLDKLHFNWGEVELYKSPKGYRSAVIEKHGLLWFNQATFVSKNGSGAINTIGFVSFSHPPGTAVTVLAVQTTNSKVAYIKAGPMSDRVRKQIKPGTPTLFSWNQMFNNSDLDPIAFSKDGHELYQYRYPKNKSDINLTADLQWYPVSGSQ